MSAKKEKTPGLALVALLLAILVCWAGAMRASRPIVRDSGRLPSAAEAEARRNAWPDMRIELNSAGEEELSLLPGIGPRLASRIVADRAENGPYQTVHDLDRVKWIGPALIERIRPYVVIEIAAESSADFDEPATSSQQP